MAYDAHKNFAYSTVATAPSPADTGTSLAVASGDGAKFPAVPFNATVWPVGVQPTTTNAEVVRVTARTTDTLTITRAQESSTARSIVVGDQIAATITAQTLTDVENSGLVAQGVASTFVSNVVMSAGNLMSIATGGATDAGSLQLVNVLSSATTASSVSSANAVGAMASRFALEGHQHAGVGPIGLSNIGNTAGDTGALQGRFILAGGNNITLSGSTSANNNYTVTVSVGNYLTTAMLSNAATISNINISGGTTSNNLSAFVLSNSNGVSFGLNGSTLTASHNALTTAALSTQTLAFTLGGNFSTTNSSQILNSGYLLAGGNNVTLQQSNNTVSVSVGNYITTAMLSNAATISNVNLSAGTTSNNLSAFVLSNSNGNSFGLNGSTITASHSVPVVSNALQDINTATGSGTNVSRFAADDHVHRGVAAWDVNGIASTFYGTQQLSAGALMSLATGGNSTRGSAQIINLLSSATTVSSVGSANAVGAMASRFALEGHIHAGVVQAQISGNTSNTSNIVQGSLVLAGGNNITLSQVSAAGAATITISAGAGAAGVGGLAAGSNTGNTAGNTASQTGTWVLAGTNNITVSGSTGAGGVHTAWLSAPTPGAGGGATLDLFVNLDLGVETTVGFNTTNLTGRTASLILQPLMGNYDPFPGNITANTVYLRMSMSGSAAAMSAANTTSVFLGIYTQNVSTLSLLNSVVTTWGNAASSNNSTMSAGIRWLTIDSSLWSAQPSFSAAHYFWGVMLRTSGQTVATAALVGNTIWASASATASGTIGVATIASATSQGMAPWYGVYSAATSSLPASIGSNQLNKQTDVAIFNPLIMMLRTGPQTF